MSGLSSLFSVSTLEKFQRKEKPVEFISKQKHAAEVKLKNLERSDPEKFERMTIKKRKRAERRAAEGSEGRKDKEREEEEETTELPQTEEGEHPSEEAAAVGATSDPASSSASMPRKDEFTLFVGNVPKTETMKTLKTMFSQYGEVESVRLRSVPVAGTAIDEAGNQAKVRKVCVQKSLFSDTKGSFNAYIVFAAQSSVEAALAANNTLIGKRHIRCDRVPPTLFDPKRSIFIGNLPHYADEEDLRQHFGKVLPQGDRDIESVRLIRDTETLLCKGIGYVLFTSADCVLKALALHLQPYRKRELRVTTCGKRTKRTVARSGSNALPPGDAPLKRPFAGMSASSTALNGKNALKRLEKKVRLVYWKLLLFFFS